MITASTGNHGAATVRWSFSIWLIAIFNKPLLFDGANFYLYEEWLALLQESGFMLHACGEFKALEIMGQLTDLSLLISIFFFIYLVISMIKCQ